MANPSNPRSASTAPIRTSPFINSPNQVGGDLKLPKARHRNAGYGADDAKYLKNPDQHHHENNDVQQTLDCASHRNIGVDQPHDQPRHDQYDNNVYQAHKRSHAS